MTPEGLDAHERIRQARAAADAERRKIGELRLTVAIEQQRPCPRNFRAFLRSGTSQLIRPRYGKKHLDWDWMDRATVIVGAMPVSAAAPFLEMIDGDGHTG